MPTIADKLKNTRTLPGTNAPGLYTAIEICLMEELLNGDVLPTPDADKHNISADIQWRPVVTAKAAVAANPSATPPVLAQDAVEARVAGGCIVVEVSQKKNSMKMNSKSEDGYWWHEPNLEFMIPRTNATTSYNLNLFNGTRCFVGFRDNNKQRRIAINVMIKVEPLLDDNSNAYKITMDLGILSEELYFYTGKMVMKP